MHWFAAFIRGIIILAFAGLHSEGFSALNSWVNPASGNWHVATNWSLGILPNSSHSVLIENPGWKAVAITPVTSANFPASLTVLDLTVRNSNPLDLNTLLLNFAGTTTPLRVLNGLAIQRGGRLVNLNSGLVVEGGSTTVTNAEVIQDGGLVRATNGSFNLHGAAYYLTNGLFEAGFMLMAPPSNSVFQQFGGSAVIRQLDYLGAPVGNGGGTYTLFGGQLRMQNLNLVARSCPAFFVQNGGTNRTQVIFLSVDLSGGPSQYTLNGGRLVTSNTTVFTEANSSQFVQNGGVHQCTNELSLQGGIRTGTVRPGSYILTGGQLFTPSVVVRSFGSYNQSNGFASVFGTMLLTTGTMEFQRWSSSLAGGILGCSSFQSSGIGQNFFHTGGTLIVTNLFSFGGTAPFPGGLPDYNFSGGTINASNMSIEAEFILGSSAVSGRITNPGFFRLSGIMRAGNANEQLGRFILGGTALLDMGLGNAILRFAPSGAETWNGSASLVVTNWSGSTNGGGSDQLRFGSNASGLNASQVRQIVFANPSGFAPGNYPAQILSTGEVVPAARASLSLMRSGTNLVLSWPAGWFLQTSTNVVGPYVDVAGATSPFTVQVTGEPQRYFRLRR